MGYRTPTSMQRGLNKVRKARIIVIVLLIAVAVAIVLIDKKVDKSELPQVDTANFNPGDIKIPSADNLNLVDNSVENKVVNDLVDNKVKEESNEKVISPIKPITTANYIQEVKETYTPKKEEIKKSYTHNKKSKITNNKKEKRTYNRKKRRSYKTASVSFSKKGDFAEYRVRRGDTLGKIAQKYYGSIVYWTVIKNANNIKNSKSLKINQKIVLPKLPNRTKNTKVHRSKRNKKVYPKSQLHHKRFYIVKRGQTLEGIAKLLGMRAYKLFANNKHLKNPDVLSPGTKLYY